MSTPHQPLTLGKVGLNILQLCVPLCENWAFTCAHHNLLYSANYSGTLLKFTQAELAENILLLYLLVVSHEKLHTNYASRQKQHTGQKIQENLIPIEQYRQWFVTGTCHTDPNPASNQAACLLIQTMKPSVNYYKL